MTTSLSSCTLAFFLSPDPPSSFPAHSAPFSHSSPELFVITQWNRNKSMDTSVELLLTIAAPAGQRHQEGQIPPCSLPLFLCSVAELSCCHGLFQADFSFSFTWKQKRLPSSLDLGNSSVDGAPEIFWDVDITGISICSVCYVAFPMALEIFLPPTHLCL